MLSVEPLLWHFLIRSQHLFLHSVYTYSLAASQSTGSSVDASALLVLGDYWQCGYNLHSGLVRHVVCSQISEVLRLWLVLKHMIVSTEYVCCRLCSATGANRQHLYCACLPSTILWMCFCVEMLSECPCTGNASEWLPVEANAACHTISTAHWEGNCSDFCCLFTIL